MGQNSLKEGGEVFLISVTPSKERRQRYQFKEHAGVVAIVLTPST